MFRRNSESRELDRPYQAQWRCTIDGCVPLDLLSLHWSAFHKRHERVLAARPDHANPRPVLQIPAIGLHEDGVDAKSLGSTLQRLWLRGAGVEEGQSPVRMDIHRHDGRDTVIITAHHAFVDGGGKSIILRDVVAPALRGETNPRDEQAPDFGAFVRWMEEQGASEAVLRHWTERFDGVEVGSGLDWLANRHAPGAARRFGMARREIDAARTARIREVLAICGARPSTVSHLATGLLLASGAGAPSAAFGSVRAMRDVPVEGVRDMVANLVNVVGVRIDARSEATIRELLGEVRARDIEARASSGVAIHDLQRIARLGTGSPLELLVVHADATAREMAAHDLSDPRVVDAALWQQPTTPVVISIGFGASIEIEVQWDGSRISDSRAEAFADRLAMLLAELGGDPDRRWCDLACASPRDLQQVARVGDGGATSWEPGRLDEAFLASCERDGSAIAVTDGATSIDYRGVLERALGVAAALDRCGADRAHPVGICMPRDVLLPACHLGCWLGGRYFVPLDPELPDDRLRMLVQEAGIRAILVGAADRARWDAEAATGLHRIEPAGDLPAATAPRGDRAPSDLAYAFFTSGSTGKPKLALVEHRGALNYLR
ncbi:MAG: AMP-binding protein, partial [Planctomycetaceae bacterium]|nr:AMP-binding protein [Planctomycetaceae bacterium]